MLSYYQATGRKKTKIIKVYNKAQKDLLLDSWKSGYNRLAVDIKRIAYDRRSITYEVSSGYAMNLNGFLEDFFANLKALNARMKRRR